MDTYQERVHYDRGDRSVCGDIWVIAAHHEVAISACSPSDWIHSDPIAALIYHLISIVSSDELSSESFHGSALVAADISDPYTIESNPEKSR